MLSIAVEDSETTPRRWVPPPPPPPPAPAGRTGLSRPSCSEDPGDGPRPAQHQEAAREMSGVGRCLTRLRGKCPSLKVLTENKKRSVENMVRIAHRWVEAVVAEKVAKPSGETGQDGRGKPQNRCWKTTRDPRSCALTAAEILPWGPAAGPGEARAKRRETTRASFLTRVPPGRAGSPTQRSRSAARGALAFRDSGSACCACCACVRGEGRGRGAVRRVRSEFR